MLDVVRDLQAIETELGVPQTPVEVAMDDWALATVADLEDRTRVRAVQGSVVSSSSSSSRRRKRRANLQGTAYSAVGTVVRESVGGQRPSSQSASPRTRRMQLLTWTIVACAVLVLALGATAVLVLVRANSSDIPVVSDISAEVSASSVEFGWNDPGLADADAYQIDINGGGQSVQSQEAFVVDTEPGDYVCITVRVTRAGWLGAPSNPKCVEITE